MEEKGVEIYKAQTVAVESLLDHHPEFNPAADPQFSVAERRAFAAVFQPNWDEYGNDYRQVYAHFSTAEPELMRQAQEVLRKFFKRHGVDGSGLELMA